MTPAQITLVQESWEQVIPIAREAATLFYDKLFELDPSLKTLFPEDLEEQKKKLTDMLTVAVNGLTKLEDIVPAVQNLGRKHVEYNVQDPHFDTVGEALLWTLEQGLGEKFTAEVQEAWVVVYTLLATTMKEAASEAVG